MKKPAANKGLKGKQKKSKTEEDEDQEGHDATNPFLEKHRKGDDEEQGDDGEVSDDGMDVRGRQKKTTKKATAKKRKSSGDKKKKSKKPRKNDGGDGSNSSETEDDVATAARMELDRAMERAQEAEMAAHPNIELTDSQHSQFEARSELFNVATGWGRRPCMFTAGPRLQAQWICLAVSPGPGLA